MQIAEVLPRLKASAISPGLESIPFSGIAADTRALKPGDIFVAIKGSSGDGHQHLDAAFKSGACFAVVSDQAALNGRPGIVVSDPRRALSTLASWIYGDPSRHLKVIAITGTNGKTTTHWLLHHALNNLGIRSLRIGTIGVVAEGVIDLPGVLTTPDPISLHKILAESVNAGVQACVMEASSHALHQLRVEDLSIDAGVFTNLTRDHLDYHGSMENYLEAKLHLFDLIAQNGKPNKASVINFDSECAAEIRARVNQLGLEDFGFSRAGAAPIKIAGFTERQGNSTLELKVNGLPVSISTPLVGAHNAENLAAAFGALVGIGISLKDAASSLSDVSAAPGRLEYIAGKNFGVFVDYAHSPDALKRVLEALRPTTRGKLWAVFGCGGDRDKGKRPEMGKIAAGLADQVVVTSDNPRTEDALKIISDIIDCGATFSKVEPDRRAAIRWAIQQAAPGDTILIAGKGHEDYQIIGTVKHHFSDQEEVRNAIQSLGI